MKKISQSGECEVLSLDEITKTKQVKMNKNNYWLLKLIYGDAAYDRTARFQLPHNVVCRTLTSGICAAQNLNLLKTIFKQ